ncbi:hypothetical protein PHET_00814 [Paragonimus heterotremus]|uniref:Uncharacterized protein n=1 Tax=Paragonimus heterotremus TaxID=100268 RepID=A0A8J4TSA2_9TREM|nr:hypothetical protein PHET_00814 [Paragonimus heterotremus]
MRLLRFTYSSSSVPVLNEPLSSLNVPQPNGGFIDPRRHSYGCSETASANSLLTVNICEGPFVTPLNTRMTMHRNSTQSVQHSLHRQVICSGLYVRHLWYFREFINVLHILTYDI